MTDHGLDIAVIGNGRTAALVDPEGRLVWWCWPRFDGDPVFCRLLAGAEEKGFADVLLDGLIEYESEYVRNTAILTTLLTDQQGAAVRITDFAPRYQNLDRTFRPPQLIRMLEPVSGLPRITIRMRPAHSYGIPITQRTQGSNHIRYLGGDNAIRLTTDAPLSYIENETPFVLNRPLHLVLGPDESISGDLSTICREFCNRTRDYWQNWVRRIHVSYDWQDAIIRAAITLKLSNFEETGAIVAAHTTSIPEAPGSGRTWDYRFCWLRDAYFVVKALNRLGATRTMEDFITYIISIAANRPDRLRPVYGVVPSDSMEERTAPNLAGFRGDGPVRIGNAAALQDQHDIYGSIVLAAMPMFFDRRLPRPGDEALFHLLEALATKASEVAFKPDSGIWEYRGRRHVHTYSAAMCWAAVNRVGAIAAHLGLVERAAAWNATADKIAGVLLDRAWNPRRKAFASVFDTDDVDASLLLLPELGVIEATDERFIETVATIERELLREKHVIRYANMDDFGLPETAFLVCRFWLIDVWWLMGRREQARDLLLDALRHRNRYGLLSEDIHPVTGKLWGNFPQTYSMAGLITSAMRLSRSWEDRYWRG